mgnify:CR=1 FL=1
MAPHNQGGKKKQMKPHEVSRTNAVAILLSCTNSAHQGLLHAFNNKTFECGGTLFWCELMVPQTVVQTVENIEASSSDYNTLLLSVVEY